MSDQLRKDLKRKIDDDLFVWVRRSTELYEMADLPSIEAMEDILQTLMGALASAGASFHFPKALYLEVISQKMDRIYKLYDKYAANKATK